MKQEYIAILREYGTPEHVIRHCDCVSQVALNIALALNAADILTNPLDAALVEKAASLHDIARANADHEQVGARIVGKFDPVAAAIISRHMHHDFPTQLSDISETDILCIADRSVQEDEYVGYEPRMLEILARFPGDPIAAERLGQKIRETAVLIERIEAATGRTIDEIALGGRVPIRKYLKRVERPGRYIGGEINMIVKDPAEVAVRFGFAFPDLYEIGMSYTGMQILYGLLNAGGDTYCERVFAPALDMEALMRENDLPLFTLETHSALRELDIVGFTLQYEQCYTNVINMLTLADIPVTNAERSNAARTNHSETAYPLIIAGGPCCYNPEPLADVFDLILIGDGEELLPELIDLYRDCKEHVTRTDFLRRAAALQGVYVPSFYKPVYNGGVFSHFEKTDASAPDRVEKRVVRDLGTAFFPERPIVPLIETVQERAVVEIFRGCGRACRFCQAGFVYRPVRRRSAEQICALIDAQLANTGYDEVSLLALSAGDYPGIEELVAKLIDDLSARNISLSLPSLRLDSLSETSLQKLGAYKKSGLTFAPEVGTQRLRDVIHKNITEEHIMTSIERAIRIGWTKVKLYFMIGLPTETYEDLDGIVDLATAIMRKARGLQEKGRRSFNLTVSVSNFVPKPNTPFQWCTGNTEEELKAKNFYLKDRFRGVKGVNFQFHDTRTSFVEMLLAKGDRRTLQAIREAVAKGCRFDSWREHFHYELWMDAFRTAGIPLHDCYTNPDAALPWDVISIGEKDELRKLYEQAVAL